MNYHEKIIGDIEEHSVEGIRDCFAHGVSPNDHYNGQPLIYELTSEYFRSPAFKDCVRVFIDHGLMFEDKVLLAVLSNDAGSLQEQLTASPDMIHRKYTLRSAFTPLYEASLLHICAEFNHVDCAEILVQYGADINTQAGVDENGFGGQTPVFHTVNQNQNASSEMLEFLLDAADLRVTVKGLIWGKGYQWETFIPSVNPISYCMMGLLPQMHRNEKVIAQTVSRLLKAAFGTDYTPGNVPCAYLNS